MAEDADRIRTARDARGESLVRSQHGDSATWWLEHGPAVHDADLPDC